MIVGERLLQLRQEKKLSQGDIEKRTGLLRCYISRCEHGNTVPSIPTLEKWAGALEVPLYRLFYDGKAPKKLLFKDSDSPVKDTPEIKQLAKLLAKMKDRDKSLLLRTAAVMARKARK